MKTFRNILLSGVLTVLVTSCGVHGDPGYVFFSLDWEYYSDDYAVTYYEDDNSNVPIWADIIPELYYDCYPGTYDYYYESEDPNYFYDYTGYYTLEQIPGSTGGVFLDGMNGADTYFDLYLYVVARKSLSADFDMKKSADSAVSLGREGEPIYTEKISRTELNGAWKLSIEEEVRVYRK